MHLVMDTHSLSCLWHVLSQTPSTTRLPREQPPTPYSVNDLALGSPAAAANTAGASFLLFSSSSPSSLINSVHQTPFLYSAPILASFILRPSVCPARVSCLGCSRRSGLSPVPSHTSPRAQKHTHTCGQDVPHRFKPCKEISLTRRVQISKYLTY